MARRLAGHFVTVSGVRPNAHRSLHFGVLTFSTLRHPRTSTAGEDSAAGVAFADSHSEIHKWVGPSMRSHSATLVTYADQGRIPVTRGDKDVDWYHFKTPRVRDALC